jgi:hypothetical protein
MVLFKSYVWFDLIISIFFIFLKFYLIQGEFLHFFSSVFWFFYFLWISLQSGREFLQNKISFNICKLNKEEKELLVHCGVVTVNNIFAFVSFHKNLIGLKTTTTTPPLREYYIVKSQLNIHLKRQGKKVVFYYV